MTTDEKIASLSEKAAVKRQKLAEITAAIERKKEAAKNLNAELDSIAKNIFDLETQRLFGLLKSKNIGIDTVIEAVSEGIFDDNNGAINSTENTIQEEKTDEISSSGKTIGNA